MFIAILFGFSAVVLVLCQGTRAYRCAPPTLTTSIPMPTIEMLPTELLLEIFCWLDSTQDLYSTIATSPRFLSILRAHKTKLLWDVLRHAIHPLALKHAVTAVSIPRVRHLLSQPERERVLEGFLWENLNRHDKAVRRLTCPIALIRLAKLQTAVERVMAQYVGEVLTDLEAICGPSTSFYAGDEAGMGRGSPSMDHVAPYGEQNEPLILSDTERARLEAAFYRYEILTRSIRLLEENLVGCRHLRTDIFPNRLRPWEVEELACLNQYFLSNIDYYFIQAEEQLINEISSSEIHGFGEAGSILSNRRNPGRCINIGGSPLHMFSKLAVNWGIRYNGMRCLASHGLRFLQELLSPTTHDGRRLDLLRCTEGSEYQGYLDHALKIITQVDVPCPLPAAGEVVLEPNLFYWEYTSRHIYQQSSFLDERVLGLLDLGYVFWDTCRIQSPRARQALWMIGSPADTWQNILSWSEYTRPSVEEQVEHMVISPSAFERLEIKYGQKYYSAEDWE